MAAYTPTTWVAGTTKVNPTNMNHIEQGIAAALPTADLLATLLGIDGSGSGIDADKLDGKELNAIWADTDIAYTYSGASGYIKLKNGFMMQFGSIYAHVQYYTSSFYTTFPNECKMVLVTVKADTGQLATSARANAWTTTTFDWDSWSGGSGANAGYINYIAIGR